LTGYGFVIDTITSSTANLTKANMVAQVLAVFDHYASEDVATELDVTVAARQTMLVVDPVQRGHLFKEQDFFHLLSLWIISRSHLPSNRSPQTPSTDQPPPRIPASKEAGLDPNAESPPFPTREAEITHWATSHTQSKIEIASAIDSTFEFALFDTHAGIGRNIFRSQRGWAGVGPVGWNRAGSPPAVQVGDFLALVCTVSTPMVLRPRADGAYTVVGSAHVGNLSEVLARGGEAWLGSEPGPLRFR
jgi:hypothetical protein